MPDHPTVDVLDYETYEGHTEEHGIHVVFRAATISIDGVTTGPQGQTRRKMFQLYADGDGLCGAAQRCQASRPPIDEDVWLQHGVITDGTWVYSGHGWPRGPFRRSDLTA